MDANMLSIDKIGLSNRAINALHRAGVNTLEDMLNCTEESLLQIRNLGQKTVEEIVQKKAEYQEKGQLETLAEQGEIPENFEAWLAEQNGQDFVRSYLKQQQIKLESLELLSARAYNLLTFNGLDFLYQVIFLDMEAILAIPRMDVQSAENIVRSCKHYLRESETMLRIAFQTAKEKPVTIYDLATKPEKKQAILRYAQINDWDLETMELSNRAKNRLQENGYEKISQILFLTREDLMAIPKMGTGSVKEILSKVQEYLTHHEKRLRAACDGDESALWDDDVVRNQILELYQNKPFDGLSLQDFRDGLYHGIAEARIKSLVGSLIADGKLEYVDFRCYRVYDRFQDCVQICPSVPQRGREFITRRLSGEVLENIAQTSNLTRERVRQIVKKNLNRVRSWHTETAGIQYFDEDYYRYFYETYDFDMKVGECWLGITPSIYHYMEMIDVKRKKKSLQTALEDSALDNGLRLKIKNYLNRNKIFLDGVWVEKTRADLEEYVVRKFCRENVTFEEFIEIYNQFLKREEIPYDDSIYCTEEVQASRKNRLAEARFLLWKQSGQLRYYEVDSWDYTELLETLNFEVLENIELSTLKFMDDYPDIMEKYDIRDQYELHNLLRKIVPEDSFHQFRCGKMPMISFGTFNRADAMKNLMINNAPISFDDFVRLVRQEYGFESGAIPWKAINEYYHQGMFTIDQKIMPAEHKEVLRAQLTEDFYTIEEVRTLFARCVPNGDLEEVNPYNLKTMGFLVFTRCVLQNYESMDAYFRYLLTKDEIVDIVPYRKKFAYIQGFSGTLQDLKRQREVIEFEPNQFVNIHKLEKNGVTKENLQEFCNQVYDFLEDGAYFSVKSLQQNGFQADLFDLGFSDWFYSNVLATDLRFSHCNIYGNIVLYKGKLNISIQSFETALIRESGSLDCYDLMTKLEKEYGCRAKDKWDVVYKVQGSEVYYDKMLDRLYSNAELYYRELDEMEDIV